MTNSLDCNEYVQIYVANREMANDHIQKSYQLHFLSLSHTVLLLGLYLLIWHEKNDFCKKIIKFLDIYENVSKQF
jgi:hypothetical protein